MNGDGRHGGSGGSTQTPPTNWSPGAGTPVAGGAEEGVSSGGQIGTLRSTCMVHNLLMVLTPILMLLDPVSHDPIDKKKFNLGS